MGETNSWRELLREITEEPHEKHRICQELSIQPITLTRWINGDTDPRPQNLYHLLSTIPQYREQLIDLLQLDERFVDFSFERLDKEAHEIPVDFYINLLKNRATMLDSARYKGLGRVILQQAISQLDPEKLGMSVSIVRCMPKSRSEQKIHSLRESIGIGNPPWGRDRELNAMFLGAESLCGYVVTTGEEQINQDVQHGDSLIPAHKTPEEKSAAVYPIVHEGKIAGALLISSTQLNYFVAEARLNLMKTFANLIALIFEPYEFYDSFDIQLAPMPDQQQQAPYFANYRQRVLDLLSQSRGTEHEMSSSEAEDEVWRRLEEELLSL